MHTVTVTSLKMHLKSQMKIKAQEAQLYLLKGKNGYVELKFGKYNYGLQTRVFSKGRRPAKFAGYFT